MRWRSFFFSRVVTKNRRRESFSWRAGTTLSPNSYYLLHNNKNRCEGTYTCTREETRERSISRMQRKKSRHRERSHTDLRNVYCSHATALWLSQRTKCLGAAAWAIDSNCGRRFIALVFYPGLLFSRKIRRSRVFSSRPRSREKARQKTTKAKILERDCKSLTIFAGIFCAHFERSADTRAVWLRERPFWSLPRLLPLHSKPLHQES